ncbi:hypothetical protein [Micromonospora sp. NPDC047730]|uniref:hypothetical protein n=1 Tax=Micromonospora sp. NPDC047730 TaxID=3364253 RepID=UPI0037126639
MTEMMRDLDAALSFGTSWMAGGKLTVRAIKGTCYMVRVLGPERAELDCIETSRGLVQMAGWHDPAAGLSLPPNIARKAWEMSQVKRAA